MTSTALTSRAVRTASLVGVLAALACSDADEALPPTPTTRSAAAHVRYAALADGEWQVARRLASGSVLLRARDALPDSGILVSGDSTSSVRLRVVTLALPGVDAVRARSLHVGLAGVRGDTVVVALPAASPALVASAHDDRFVLIEEANAIWSVDHRGVAARATALRVGGYDFEALAARQREGEVILYWAAVPVIHPTAREFAYASNREAVANEASGQSIWYASPGAAEERVVLARPGRSFRPIGWLADSVVYIGDEPGVWVVSPRDSSSRRIDSGTYLDVASDGSAVATADGVPDSTRVRIVKASGRMTRVAAPAPGFTYGAQGAFSPGGRHLLLEASADSGRVRRFYIADGDSGGIVELDPPAGASFAERPVWAGPGTLLVLATDSGGATSAFLAAIVDPADSPGEHR